MTDTFNRSPTLQIVLLVSGSFVFSYCFGVFMHEVGHVLAYLYYGIPTSVFVVHPFGRSYMKPGVDIENGLLLIGVSGSLFNIACAMSCSFVFRHSRNLMLLPLLMWRATSLLQEAVAMNLDMISGGRFDWAKVVATGIPMSLVVWLSIIFLVVGCISFLRLLALAGVTRGDSLYRILVICSGAIVPFFLVSFAYAWMFDQTLIYSKLVALASSVALSAMVAVLFKPAFPYLEEPPDYRSGNVEWKHAAFATGLALSVVIAELRLFG